MLPSEPARDIAKEVGEHLRAGRSAVLSTLSVHDGIVGFPFGSTVPYALTPEGSPILLLSGLAEHTRNLLANPRASLLVQEPGPRGEPQTEWRITLVGTLERVSDPGARRDELMERYRLKVPGSAAFAGLPDFHPWVLRIQRIRFIAGFGRIHWVEPSDLAPAVD